GQPGGRDVRWNDASSVAVVRTTRRDCLRSRPIPFHDLVIHFVQRTEAVWLVAAERARSRATCTTVAMRTGTLGYFVSLKSFDQIGIGDQRSRHRDEIAFLVVERAFNHLAILESTIGNHRQSDLVSEPVGVIEANAFLVAPTDVE